MKRVLIGLFLAAALALPVRAELVIEITAGRDNPTSIAVVPFAWSGWGSAPEDVAAAIAADLLRSGQFAPVARADMLGLPTRESEVYYRDWRTTNVEYLLIGRVSGGSTVSVEYELFDVFKQEGILVGRETGPVADLRMLAHRASDKVYYQLTGIRGAFATRILYVAFTRRPGADDNYQLMVADADGARAELVLESSQPILSPAWSPDGNQIAYVSFESTRPAIYRHDLSTGQRERLTNFKGLNGAPAWSPDGNSLAMVLSRDGSPDLYILDLASRKFRRLTRHYAIETEPAWMPDGRSLIFTSDRGGRPQIYRIDVVTGRTERLTYEGSWNARASVAADGRTMVLVHRRNDAFHIAVQDLERERLQILTSTALDESPSVAPNGSMVLYATKHDGRGILAAVSVDGRVKFRLPSREGDVREPAWSPYMGEP
ncbi:MAG: Tol-Pal system beta propeller repeat protein TolB [Gammaproteobacteria bacterium]|nr:Tol-Pal system beta propeller repeat protein TolB [Gammaproteobacteria bacterium]